LRAFAAGDLDLERVKPLVPEASIRLEPSIDLLERTGVDCVQSPRA
jgi:hypothetical protein